MMKKIFCAFLIFVFPFICKAEVSVSLSKNKISEGQNVQLILSSDKDIKNVDGLAALRQDFVVGGQGHSSRTSIVNGKMTSAYDVSIVLTPLKTGTLNIPALLIDGEATKPLSLEVVPARSSMPLDDVATNKKGLFIESYLSKPTVWQNAALIYTVKLYDRLGIVSGEILPPTAKDAQIQQLTEDKVYAEVKDGLKYQVIERQYVIFPSNSGRLTIEPAAFKGAVYDKTKSSQTSLISAFGFPDDLMFPSGRGRDVFVRAPILAVDVKEKPNNLKNKWWLPASDVSMTDSYNPKWDEIQTGEPLRRTITVEAVGVLGTNIPDLEIKQEDGFKVYPETPKKENVYVPNKGLVGISEQTFVFVPVQAGALFVPSVSLDWFDVDTGKLETTNLLGKDVQVFATPNASIQTPIQKEKTYSQEKMQITAKPSVTEPVYSKENSILFFASGLCIGLLLTMVLWFVISRIKIHRHRSKKLPDLYPSEK